MMNEQENAQQIQPEADDVEVEVVEQDIVEASPDDELENYTKSVSKRINKSFFELIALDCFVISIII